MYYQLCNWGLQCTISYVVGDYSVLLVMQLGIIVYYQLCSWGLQCTISYVVGE